MVIIMPARMPKRKKFTVQPPRAVPPRTARHTIRRYKYQPKPLPIENYGKTAESVLSRLQSSKRFSKQPAQYELKIKILDDIIAKIKIHDNAIEDIDFASLLRRYVKYREELGL